MITTTKLNDGTTVLAKPDGTALQYANLAMARYKLGRMEPILKADSNFSKAWVRGRFPFVIVVEFREAS